MNKRLFFLRQDGWFEFQMTGNLSSLSLDDLIGWAYGMMERHQYRNYWITESSHRPCGPPLSNHVP